MQLPEWCAPLPSASQMRAVDGWAIETRKVPSLDLMERAGEAVARAVERVSTDGPVTVLCGKGNNGGDGLVAARLLRAAARPVTVLLLVGQEELRGDALENLRRLPGDPPVALLEGARAGEAHDLTVSTRARSALEEATVIVDALLGTGFKGVAEGAVAAAIDAVNDAPAPVVAVDVPSGVDASSGVVEGPAVSAAATVTFHACKPGLWIDPGKRRRGRLQTADIGIPRGAPVGAQAGLIEPDVLALLPRRGATSTKFTSGHALIVGGSVGLTGAPAMACEAAMRAGAGYVTACVPRSLQPILASGGRPEMMTRGLAEEDGALVPKALEEALSAARRGGAIALGPGLGRTDGAVAFAQQLAREVAVPAVIDADGLNAHAGALPLLASRRHPTVLTPHAGELGRLLGIDSAEVQMRRLECVRQAASEASAVVVLKGDDTLVAAPDGFVAVSPGASPALATAGTGDVLSGVIVALLAQGLSAFDAACAGVYLHLVAGRVAAVDQGCEEGVIATDVIAALPRARGRGAST